jgi:hypothetical protein
MIKNALIFILACFAVFLFFDKSGNKTFTETNIDTLTLITYKDLIKITKGDSIPFTILDTIYETDYDTIEIVSDYKQVKQYTDTIKQDSNIYVIRDTISQNRIIGRSFQAKVQEKTITITNNIVRNPQPALYVGIRSDLSNDMSRLNHNLNISFKTAKKGLISVGYGMSGYSIGYSIKL